MKSKSKTKRTSARKARMRIISRGFVSSTDVVGAYALKDVDESRLVHWAYEGQLAKPFRIGSRKSEPQWALEPMLAFTRKHFAHVPAESERIQRALIQASMITVRAEA